MLRNVEEGGRTFCAEEAGRANIRYGVAAVRAGLGQRLRPAAACRTPRAGCRPITCMHASAWALQRLLVYDADTLTGVPARACIDMQHEGSRQQLEREAAVRGGVAVKQRGCEQVQS